MPATEQAGSHLRLAAGAATLTLALTGAEPVSWQVGGRDLLWHGDPAHWNRSAPILFPVVGASAGGVVLVDGRPHPMPQHGFARDCRFTLVESGPDWARLRLCESDATWPAYPFRFVLDVVARLTPDTVSLDFEVTNTDTTELPYGLGFHPAFPWPLGGADGTDRSGHAVTFEAEEDPLVPTVAPGGLLARERQSVNLQGRVLPLEPAMFTEALVFLDARSRAFRYGAPSGAGIQMRMQDFPHLAVWSKPTAPFVSLECWTDHADWAGFAGELRDRASIRRLAPGASARHAVQMQFEPATL